MTSVFTWSSDVQYLEIDRGDGTLITITTEDEWTIEVLKG